MGPCRAAAEQRVIFRFNARLMVPIYPQKKCWHTSWVEYCCVIGLIWKKKIRVGLDSSPPCYRTCALTSSWPIGSEWSTMAGWSLPHQPMTGPPVWLLLISLCLLSFFLPRQQVLFALPFFLFFFLPCGQDKWGKKNINKKICQLSWLSFCQLFFILFALCFSTSRFFPVRRPKRQKEMKKNVCWLLNWVVCSRIPTCQETIWVIGAEVQPSAGGMSRSHDAYGAALRLWCETERQRP